MTVEQLIKYLQLQPPKNKIYICWLDGRAINNISIKGNEKVTVIGESEFYNIKDI